MNAAQRMGMIGLLVVTAPAAAAAGHGNWYGGVQWLMLSADVDTAGFDDIFYEGVDHAAVETEGAYDGDLNSGVRFILGKQDCCGCGLQVRYFNYNNNVAYSGLWNAGAGTVLVSGISGVEVDALDLEMTKRHNRGGWDVQCSAGVRYGAVEFSQPAGFFAPVPAVINAGPTGTRYEGVGPTLATSGVCDLGHGLSFVGQARVGLLFLFSDTMNNSAFQAAPSASSDEFAQSWEFQVGLNYETRLGGHDVLLGLFYEIQHWNFNSTLIGDLTLQGLGLSAGTQF